MNRNEAANESTSPTNSTHTSSPSSSLLSKDDDSSKYSVTEVIKTFLRRFTSKGSLVEGDEWNASPYLLQPLNKYPSHQYSFQRERSQSWPARPEETKHTQRAPAWPALRHRYPSRVAWIWDVISSIAFTLAATYMPSEGQNLFRACSAFTGIASCIYHATTSPSQPCHETLLLDHFAIICTCASFVITPPIRLPGWIFYVATTISLFLKEVPRRYFVILIFFIGWIKAHAMPKASIVARLLTNSSLISGIFCYILEARGKWELGHGFWHCLCSLYIFGESLHVGSAQKALLNAI